MSESSIVAVSNALQKALRGLGLDVSKDTTPVDSRQSNGPVEQTVEIVRQRAAVLMSDLEHVEQQRASFCLEPTIQPMLGRCAAGRTASSASQTVLTKDRFAGVVKRCWVSCGPEDPAKQFSLTAWRLVG